MPQIASSPTVSLPKNIQYLLCTRYFLPRPTSPECPHCQNPHETLDEFHERVSLGRSEYLALIRDYRVLPNSPTLFNVGTGMGTLSACFKLDVEDTMESIMDVARKAALVQKWGGGVGYVFSQLRPEGAPIATTHRRACGPIGVLRHYNSVAELVTQGGKRQGAQMGILDGRHPDVRKFIHVKDADPQRLSAFNISVAWDDAFMQKVEAQEGEEYQLWLDMEQAGWRTGDPGCYFISTAERGNPTPWLGKLTGTNPCGEVPLLDNEACNLASINLSKYVCADGRFDFSVLADHVPVVVSYMDDLLDKNRFPDPAIERATLLTRKLGLGVMGWADALALMRMDYDSEAAVELGREIMSLIQRETHKQSRVLADVKGAYPGWELGAEWRARHNIADDHLLYGRRRNATLTSIAPTGTIAILTGCSSGIEPHFAESWSRTTGEGHTMQEIIPVADRLNGFHPKTAMQISPSWHVRHQAAFQEHVDLAVSKTINLPNTAPPSDVGDAYLRMWQLGCKGGTVFRYGCRNEQVLVINGNGQHPFARRKLPATRKSTTHRFHVGEQTGYIHAGQYEDETLGEVFLDISKQGSTVGGLADMLAIFMSLGLQYGVPLEEFLRKMRQSRYEPAGMTDNAAIPTATSITDYLGHWLENEFMNGSRLPSSETGLFCPDCGSSAIASEGCIKCGNCDWSRC